MQSALKYLWLVCYRSVGFLLGYHNTRASLARGVRHLVDKLWTFYAMYSDVPLSNIWELEGFLTWFFKLFI